MVESVVARTVLSIHGSVVAVESGDAELLRWITFDFASFPAAPDAVPFLTIGAHLGPVPWDIIPPVEEVARSNEYVAFERGSCRFVDYKRRALLRFDYENNTADVYSASRELVYEKLYLFILARTGEGLDARRLHRIHGLGFALNDQGALFLMPQGGGKSTLAMRLLHHDAIAIVSEDTPLLTRRSTMLPFPFRFAVAKDELPADIPREFVRTGGEAGAKAFISTEYWHDKIAKSELPVRYLLCGKWTAATQPELRPMSRFGAFAVVFRDCVVGYGLPQLIEFFIRATPGDLFKKTSIAVSRTITALLLAMRARPYKLVLCRDHDKNEQLIVSFLAGRAKHEA